MWDRLISIFQASGDGGAAGTPDEEALRVATAALLVHASRVDGEERAEEVERLHDLIRDKFGLSEAQASELISRGRESEEEAVDLYRHTRVLTDSLGPEGRAGIVEMLWEIVLSDKVLDDYEANLVWRVAELLRVSTRERVLLRKQVASRLGIED